MATATPTSSSPNPNALKFELDTTLPATLSFNSAEEAASDPFASAVFAAPGVVSIFGVNDFVTVNREPGSDWDPIIAAVQTAAASL
jgi:NFU1 iron-sulfur cluster scaffold homolog, mitochondrial